MASDLAGLLPVPPKPRNPYARLGAAVVLRAILDMIEPIPKGTKAYERYQRGEARKWLLGEAGMPHPWFQLGGLGPFTQEELAALTLTDVRRLTRAFLHHPDDEGESAPITNED